MSVAVDETRNRSYHLWSDDDPTGRAIINEPADGPLHVSVLDFLSSHGINVTVVDMTTKQTTFRAVAK